MKPAAALFLLALLAGCASPKVAENPLDPASIKAGLEARDRARKRVEEKPVAEDFLETVRVNAGKAVEHMAP